ncbi:MAG: hypothetical protein KF805_07985 [Phycisphaeraceae bacterium]|nr:hypothetical protein [Phycisphaeraceae bacterium]
MTTTTRVVAATGLCSCASALAGLSQSTISAPGGFGQACAGPDTPGSSPWPGSDFTSLHTAVGSDAQEGSFSGISSVSRNAGYSSGNISNSSGGSFGMGFISGNAHNNAPNNSHFAQADINGGWKETFLITNAAYTGQSGFMVFTLNVSGSLAAAGFAGAANFRVTGYKNDIQLMINSLFSAGNSDAISTDRQYGNWAVSTSSIGDTKSKGVSGTLTFAVPFTFGTTFNLGIYGYARAGMRSASGVAGNSTAEAILAKLAWGGHHRRVCQWQPRRWLNRFVRNRNQLGASDRKLPR